MVDTASTYDFATTINGFFAQKNIEGKHAPLIVSLVRERALALLAGDDARYMPAFKILDMLAALVNIAAAIADAPQLRPNEIRALLRESLSDTAPLVRQFLLEAALERARYEPLMLATQPPPNAAHERERILHQRWAAMRAAHQDKSPLPDHWMDTIDHAVEHALTADDFRHFRHGPLLQLFAEMLALGRTTHHAEKTLPELAAALSEEGILWRRYALKRSRYSKKQPAPADIRTLQAPHTIH